MVSKVIYVDTSTIKYYLIICKYYSKKWDKEETILIIFGNVAIRQAIEFLKSKCTKVAMVKITIIFNQID